LTKVLIDADTVAFACAASAEDGELWQATTRADEMVHRIQAATEANTVELWLSGKETFRYKVYPEYKANRLGAYRPKYEREVKDFLVSEWGANWSDGCEADDMVGVRQLEEQDTIIAHIDKDINMIPGMHYNWDIVRKGVVVSPAKTYEITMDDSWYNFYYQLIVGDPGTDNIKGVPGAGPAKATKFLNSTDRQRWLQGIRELYSCDAELQMNAQCLWIWRKYNDIWNWETDPSQELTEEIDDTGIS